MRSGIFENKQDGNLVTAVFFYDNDWGDQLSFNASLNKIRVSFVLSVTPFFKISFFIYMAILNIDYYN